jgi:hypothetical protein
MNKAAEESNLAGGKKFLTSAWTNCLVNQKRLDRAELYLENAISNGKPLSAAAVTALLQTFAKLGNQRGRSSGCTGLSSRVSRFRSAL